MRKLECPDFSLSEKITPEQVEFFQTNGLLHFRNFISRDTVQLFLSEIHRIEKELLEKGIDKINGTPLKMGKDEHGQPMIQRLCFTSLYSDPLHEFLQDAVRHPLPPCFRRAGKWLPLLLGNEQGCKLIAIGLK